MARTVMDTKEVMEASKLKRNIQTVKYTVNMDTLMTQANLEKLNMAQLIEDLNRQVSDDLGTQMVHEKCDYDVKFQEAILMFLLQR